MVAASPPSTPRNSEVCGSRQAGCVGASGDTHRDSSRGPQELSVFGACWGATRRSRVGHWRHALYRHLWCSGEASCHSNDLARRAAEEVNWMPCWRCAFLGGISAAAPGKSRRRRCASSLLIGSGSKRVSNEWCVGEESREGYGPSVPRVSVCPPCLQSSPRLSR